MISDEPYKSIIPTAYFTAYPLTFTDIPYAKEIFTTLESVLQAQGYIVEDSQKVAKLAPELEARHKLADTLLAASDIEQVLELAAGLSSRGLMLASNLDRICVELDLPDMVDTKQAVLGYLGLNPANLYLVPGNALSSEQVEMAVRHFDPKKPVAIINEGLLRYLNFEEKAAVAHNIRQILLRFGGIWLTGDITLRKLLANQDQTTMPGKNRQLAAATGKDFSANSFPNEGAAVHFFEGQGFSVEVHDFSEVIHELTSPKTLGLSDEEVTKIIEAGRVLIMRANKEARNG